MKELKTFVNKETLATVGKGAGKIGKAIIKEGTQVVVLKATAAVISQSFDNGFDSVKSLSMDDVLAGGKGKGDKKKRKSLFGRKKTEEISEDGNVEVDSDEVVVEADTVIVEVDDDTEVVIDDKTEK